MVLWRLSILKSHLNNSVIKIFFCPPASQPGPGTEYCVCRSWASTTWRFCQLTCLMTPCTSARPLMRPWGPGGPNSPSWVRCCNNTRVTSEPPDTMRAFLTFGVFPSSPPRWPSDWRGSRGSAECWRVLQPELCVSGGQTALDDRVAQRRAPCGRRRQCYCKFCSQTQSRWRSFCGQMQWPCLLLGGRRCFQTEREWRRGASCPSSPSTATQGGTTAALPPTWLFPPARAQPLPSMCTVSVIEMSQVQV